MIYVKHDHGKWVRKDLDPLNPVNQIREVANYIKRRHSKINKKSYLLVKCSNLMKNARKSPYFNAGMDRAKLT